MAVEIPFRREFSFEYGRLEPVAPMIRRIVARNPSPLTFRGTGTYVVGHGEVAVIDPGPDLADHVEALLAGLAGEQVTQLLRPRRPLLADNPHRFKAAGSLADPLPEELGDRVVELLRWGLDRTVHPMVESARGNRVERTEWHRIVIFSEGLGQIAEKYLEKGSKVYLEGKLCTRKWQDQSGADRYSTEIHLTPYNGVLIFLDSRRDGDPAAATTTSDRRGGATGGTGGASNLDDEIPF